MKIKRTLQPFIEDDNILFGFGNESLVRRIPYTLENEKLIKKLDEVDFNNLSREEKQLVKSWNQPGLLTENVYDNSKYSRNINFFEWIDSSENIYPEKYQKMLNKSTILIVGLGGIGGNIAEILVRTGVKNLILVDFDKVEESNLTRQSIFTSSDIDKYKSDVAECYLKNIDMDINVFSINKKIRDIIDLEKIYKAYDFDLALCCADTPAIEIDYWFDELSHKYDRPFITGSYASTVINYVCINPEKTISLKEFYGGNMISDDNLLENKAPTSIIAPISYMAAGLVAYRTCIELTQIIDMEYALQIDLLDWRVLKYDIIK